MADLVYRSNHFDNVTTGICSRAGLSMNCNIATRERGINLNQQVEHVIIVTGHPLYNAIRYPLIFGLPITHSSSSGDTNEFLKARFRGNTSLELLGHAHVVIVRNRGVIASHVVLDSQTIGDGKSKLPSTRVLVKVSSYWNQNTSKLFTFRIDKPLHVRIFGNLEVLDEQIVVSCIQTTCHQQGK